jgi:hypothetical protein
VPAITLPRRDHHRHRPELVIAFLGGRGTADMMRRAREAGIEVVEVGPKGPVVM